MKPFLPVNKFWRLFIALFILERYCLGWRVLQPIVGTIDLAPSTIIRQTVMSITSMSRYSGRAGPGLFPPLLLGPYLVPTFHYRTTNVFTWLFPIPFSRGPDDVSSSNCDSEGEMKLCTNAPDVPSYQQMSVIGLLYLSAGILTAA